MALTTVDDSATISTTEYSLPADTTTGVPTSQTDDCLLQCWIDFSAMASGDVYQIKVYEKVNGAGATQRTISTIRVLPGMNVYVLPMLFLAHGWDITVTRISGTDRSIGWSLRKVT